MRIYKLNKLLTEETAQPAMALFDLKGHVIVCVWDMQCWQVGP